MAHPNNRGGLISDQGYKKVYLPLHPRSDSKGYIKEHIVVAEKALGHPLPPMAHIHHVNEVRNDNRNSNLVICENNTYHKLLHRRLRSYQATGNVRSVKCVHCKRWDIHGGDADAIQISGKQIYHRSCHAANQRRLKRLRHDSLPKM